MILRDRFVVIKMHKIMLNVWLYVYYETCSSILIWRGESTYELENCSSHGKLVTRPAEYNIVVFHAIIVVSAVSHKYYRTLLLTPCLVKELLP